MRFTLLMLAACLLITVTGCGAYSSFDDGFESVVRPYSFNFARWEIETLSGDIRRNMVGRLPESELTSETVLAYFELVSRLNNLKYTSGLARLKESSPSQAAAEDEIKKLESQISDLKPAVERTLERQIGRVLAEQEIYNPFNSRCFKLTFPPVRFKLEKPLKLAVVSPRDRIEKIRDRVLIQDLTQSQMESVESSLGDLGVSALIVEIGGFGATYPSFVADSGGLRFTLETAAEEWLHQYLVFKPLGRAYALHLLNISKNADITTLNETIASTAAGEVAGLVYDRYYTRFFEDEGAVENEEPPAGFDFNATMREIRRRVDLYLAEGSIETAESYMREMRQYLADNGYYLRKLNQAYFAFYGSYASSPTSIDPVGEQVKSLRAGSASLSHFLERVSGLKSRQDLEAAAER